MNFFLKVILPILCGTVVFIFWLVEGLCHKRKMARGVDFFVPIIGTSLKLKGGGFGLEGYYYFYEGEGHFQNRNAFIATSGRSMIFGKKLSIDVAVRLRNYRLKSFQKGFGGTHFQYEGKSYLIGGIYFTYGNDKLTRRIKIADFNEEALRIVRNEFQALCNLADKIDSGEIKYDFLEGGLSLEGKFPKGTPSL